MRRSLLAVALALALGAAVVAQEPEPPKDEKGKALPLNPFEKAADGDWGSLLAKLEFVATETENPLAERLPKETLVTWRVKKVDDKVHVAIETKPASDEKVIAFSKGEPPSLETYLQMQPSEVVTDVKVSDEKKTVGGREFACKKVAFTTTCELPAVKQETVLWLCPDVKGGGMVAASMKTDSGLKIAMEVAGFGSKDKADWGKKPEEIPIKEPPKRAPEEDDGEK